MEKGLSKNQLIQELSSSPHGDLTVYLNTFSTAARQEPEFLAHLIAYNAKKGQIRDSQIGIPVVSLSTSGYPEEFAENSYAHLALLSPREILTAYKFALGWVKNKDRNTVTGKNGKPRQVAIGGWKQYHPVSILSQAGHKRGFERLVTAYLRAREDNWAWFERTVQNFRRPLKELYFLSHTKPSARAKEVLYDGIRPPGSSLEVIQQLYNMAPMEAAGAIIDNRISMLQLLPILKSKAKDPLLLMALIKRMTPTELQTNMHILEKLGVKNNPETRGALEEALVALGNSKKTVLKTTKAVDSGKVKDEGLKAKLRDVQEKQMDKLKSVDGNWLILSDKSGSMAGAIDVARHIASFLSRMVTGKVHIMFFDTSPQHMDATGKSYEELVQITRNIRAGGGTSIGCGLDAAMGLGLDVDGIVVVSDGAEHSPPYFHKVYGDAVKKYDKQVPVYFYQMNGEADHLVRDMHAAGHDIQVFDLRGGTLDYYALPQLIGTMRTNRWSLVMEIMESRLLTLDEVLKFSKKDEVHAHA